jgi:hypothetical protein
MIAAKYYIAKYPLNPADSPVIVSSPPTEVAALKEAREFAAVDKGTAYLVLAPLAICQVETQVKTTFAVNSDRPEKLR